jgi:hypothetical protein
VCHVVHGALDWTCSYILHPLGVGAKNGGCPYVLWTLSRSGSWYMQEWFERNPPKTKEAQ